MTQAGLAVILVEDDDDLRVALAQSLSLAGYRTRAFAHGEAALVAIANDTAGVVVTDIRMPGVDGRQLLRRVMAKDSELPVVLMTGHGDIAQAVESLREGAYDFLSKPFAVDRLLETIARALEKRRLVLENRRLRHLVDTGNNVSPALAGDSAAIRRLVAMIGPIGATDVDVIVQGAPGSYKIEIAQLLHAASERRRRPFVSLDCEALPELVLEAQLFGDEGQARGSKGPGRPGRIAAARSGTLHLGGIESLPLSLQLRLLRVLENRENVRGAGGEPAIDFRLIAATSVDLARAVADGRFRSDLYFRLATVQMEVPPLRERRIDVSLIFARYATAAARRFQRPVPAFDDRILARLSEHDWPGNARELQHFAEQVVLGIAGLPTEGQQPNETLQARVATFEAEMIRNALVREKGDIGRTCARLGLPRKTLYDKLARHGIAPATFRLRG